MAGFARIFTRFDFKRVLEYAIWLMRVFTLCKSPLSVISCYVRGVAPASIELRTGETLYFSGFPHDLITFFVVFIKRDYGEIPHGGVVLDVGANIGMFSVYAVRLGAEEVHAFEPSPSAFETLKKNVERNGLGDRIKLYNKAVSSVDGAHVLIPETSSPYNSVSAVVDDAKSDDSDAGVIVETISLPLFAERAGIGSITMIKIDCEGAEFDFIPALDEVFFSMVTSIKMEIHGQAENLIQHLERHGFKMIHYRKDHEADSWADAWFINKRSASSADAHS